ncbi:MAG: polysaccharide biosynthesis tyrosine autokinase [Anaerolineaceae bacterium]|nr:polysaccharide biosynthesis tyrosine autokinase [Anaerolineaceae bacterium]
MSGDEGKETSFKFDFLRRWWWVIVGCMLIAAVTAYAITYYIPPQYEATATLLIEPSPTLMNNDYSNIIVGEQLAYTYSRLLVENQILQAVIEKAGIDETPEELAKRINAEPIKDTQLIHLSVKDPSPENAALLAQTIANVFVEHVQVLEADRFGLSLKDLEAKTNTKLSQINEIQSEIDSNNAISIEKGAELTHLNSALDDYRVDYQFYQQSYLSMQLAANQVSNKVHVVEPAYTKYDNVKSIYSAITTLLIDPSLIIGEGTYSPFPTGDRVVSTYGQIWTGKPMMEEAIARLGVIADPDILKNNVRIESIPYTQLIRIRVDDPDMAQAKLFADTIGEIIVSQFQKQLSKPYTDRTNSLTEQMNVLSAKIDQTQSSITTAISEKTRAEVELTRLEELQSQNNVDYRAYQADLKQLQLSAKQASNAVVIVTQPFIPQKPTSDWIINIFLAGMVGLVVGTGAAILLDYLDESIRTRQDITHKLGLRYLGTVDVLKNGASELVMDKMPRSRYAEDFRTLGTNIRFSNGKTPLRTLLITSPSIAEGKSVITANLAIALARLGLRTIAVDGDLRLPRLHTLFGVEQGNGLANALESGNPTENLQGYREGGVQILTSGKLPANPAGLLSSPQLTKVLDELSQQADLVLIDCPPILSVVDAMILAAKVDGVLLVLRAGVTSRRVAREVTENLRQVGANLVGVVLNAAPGYRDQYYKYYGKEEKNKIRSFLDRFQGQFNKALFSRKS